MAWLYDLGSDVLGWIVAAPVVALAIAGSGAVAVVEVARRRGWIAVARRHRRASVGLGAVVLAIGLPVGWYLASPLVLSATIDEPAPIVPAAATASVRSADPNPGSALDPSAPPSAGAATNSGPATTPSSGSAAPLALRAGTFHGSDDFHFGHGTARLIETAPGSFVVRLEDFSVRNGPDLYVYLSPNADGYADGAIELGRLKADKGNQNYRVPDGSIGDADEIASVVIWCKQFSHLFATAPLEH